MSRPEEDPQPAGGSSTPRHAAPDGSDEAESGEPCPPPRHAAPVPGSHVKIDEGPLWLQWPLLVSLVIFTIGGAVAGTGHWRRGSLLMGAGVVLAGLLRLVLSESRAGLLVVRRKWFDVSVLLIAGLGMVVLSVLVPPQQ